MQYNLSDLEGTQALTFIVAGKSHAVADSHPNFPAIRAEVMGTDPDPARVLELLDAATAIATAAATAATAAGVRDTGAAPATFGPATAERVDNILADTYHSGDTGHAFAAIAAFRARCSNNPNQEAIQHLDRFIAANGLPLTADGLILCYKGVSGDLSSIFGRTSWDCGAWVNGQYSLPIYNTPGTTIALPRHHVVWDPKRLCERGLHVGSEVYAKSWGTVAILVAVDPAHVCSVPEDYHGSKMRVAGYYVVGPYMGNAGDGGYTTYNGRDICLSNLAVSAIDADTIADDAELEVPERPSTSTEDSPRTGSGVRPADVTAEGCDASNAANDYDNTDSASDTDITDSASDSDTDSTAADGGASVGAVAGGAGATGLPPQGSEFPVFVTAKMVYDRTNYSSWSNFKRAARRAYAAATKDGVVGTQVRAHGTGDWAYSQVGWRYLLAALDGTRPDVQAIAVALAAEAEDAEHALHPWDTTGRAVYAALAADYSTWSNFKRVLRRAYNKARAAGNMGAFEPCDGDYKVARSGMAYLFAELDPKRPSVVEFAANMGYPLPAAE